jgi:hypothetical protein
MLNDAKRGVKTAFFNEICTEKTDHQSAKTKTSGGNRP